MTNINALFEQATQLKLRFDSPKGLLSVEDLWGLPLKGRAGTANLDDIAVALHRQLKDSDRVSFVEPVEQSNNETQMKFDLVMHVIGVLITKRDKAIEVAKRAEKKQKILSIIAQKEDEVLLGASVEELRKIAESL